jgi:uncharacterized protein YndB with AHSA1/START domain
MNRSTFRPGPLADVGYEAEADGDRWTLVFVRDLRHPPDKVWAALTEPGQLREWAPYTAARDLGEPGDVTLTMIDGDTAVDQPATVTRAEPPSLLEHSWGTDLLRWELAPTTTGTATGTATGTRLTLRHTLQDRDWVPKIAAGWHLCLDVAGHLLDGRPVGPIRGTRAREFGWDALNEAYAAKLGIPASGLPDDRR